MSKRLEDYVNCEWCKRSIHLNVSAKHKEMCPLSPVNSRIILLWIRSYVEKSSNLKRVKLYPKAVRYNEFARQKRLLSYNSVRRIFKKTRWRDIIDAIIWIAVSSDYVTEDEFPPHLRSLYHSTQFVEPIAYRNTMAKIEADEVSLLESIKQKRKGRRRNERSRVYSVR